MYLMKKGMLLPIASLFVCAALYLVWPLAHTIALRKLLLVLGSVIGVVLWMRSDNRYAILKSPWLKLLGFLLAWVIFHASFISQNGSEAWGELLGQWIPVYLAVLTAIGLAIASQSINARIFRNYLFTLLLAQPVLFLILSVVKSIQVGHLVMGFWLGDVLLVGTDLKTSLTFSSDLLGALACARLLDMINTNTENKNKYIWLLAIVLAMYVPVIITTLNSILLLSACIAAMIVLLVKDLKPIYIRGLFLVAVLVLLGMIYAVKSIPSVAHYWDRKISTAKVAVSIDQYPNWINYKIQGLPKNEFGDEVPESFYLRVAYATAGLRTILEHPWGYGVTRHAFERLVQQEHPDADISNAHNSYINLVCAVGFPALILLLFTIVTVYRKLKKYDSEWKRPIAWMIGISVAHWALDAIERDHFVEMYIFLIALLATTMTCSTIRNGSAHD